MSKEKLYFYQSINQVSHMKFHLLSKHRRGYLIVVIMIVSNHLSTRYYSIFKMVFRKEIIFLRFKLMKLIVLWEMLVND